MECNAMTNVCWVSPCKFRARFGELLVESHVDVVHTSGMASEAAFLKATTISSTEGIDDAIAQLAFGFGEQTSVVYRQILRCAVARRWARAELGKIWQDNSPRRVVRLALPGALAPQIDEVRGDIALSTYTRLCASKFLMLHELGDRSIWALDIWKFPCA
jgi:hypothetical protein